MEDDMRTPDGKMERECGGIDGRHEYAERVCKCGATFCYSCSAGTNVDQGGKYDPDYIYCPACGRDWYQDE
jgi:hypothetical protein